MPHDELKPKDRVVLRMTRDGAVEENLTEGTSEKVSKRLEDAQLVAPHDAQGYILRVIAGNKVVNIAGHDAVAPDGNRAGLTGLDRARRGR